MNEDEEVKGFNLAEKLLETECQRFQVYGRPLGILWACKGFTTDT